MVVEPRNVVKDRLAQGELALGLSLRHSRTVDAVLVAQACGFDWLMIDLEHNSMDSDTAAQLVGAALLAGVTPLVRVPAHGAHHAGRALDAGAMGIIFPHVQSPAEARDAAAACRFPPVGARSIPPALLQLSLAGTALGQALHLVDSMVLVVVMLETPQAIAQADAIAAVPGVDVLLIGTTDLSAALGYPGEFDRPEIESAYRGVCVAAARHGKHAGMAGISDPQLMRRYLDVGPRLVLAGNDLGLLTAAARARVHELRLGSPKGPTDGT